MKKGLLSLAVVATLASTAFAGDVRVSGFTTIVAGQSQDHDELGDYDGYSDDDIRFQPGSVVGIQITGKVADNMSATAQLIGKFDNTNANGSPSAEVAVEWAYINYSLNDTVALQIGRYRPAVYLYSNTLDVGYSYVWIKPPSEFYSRVPMTYTDGINMLLNHTFDNDISLNSAIYYSSTKQDVNGFDFDLTKLYGIEATIENDYFKFRLGYVEAIMSADLSSVEGQLYTQFGGAANPQAALLAKSAMDNGLAINETSSSFASVGLTVDYMDILFVGEYAQRKIDNTAFDEDVTSYYAMLGYRIGDFTPNITYSVTDGEYKEANGTYGLGAAGDGAVNGAVNGARKSFSDDIDAIIIGLRYDVNPMADIKFEYKKINKTPATTEKEISGSIARVALDIVF